MARLSGVVVDVSSTYSDKWNKARINDGDLSTSWFTANGDAANQGKSPYVMYTFPKSVSVEGVNIRGNREYSSGYDVLQGTLELYSGRDVIFTKTIDLPKPNRDFNLIFSRAIDDVTLLKFIFIKDESIEPGLSEIEVIGQTQY